MSSTDIEYCIRHAKELNMRYYSYFLRGGRAAAKVPSAQDIAALQARYGQEYPGKKMYQKYARQIAIAKLNP